MIDSFRQYNQHEVNSKRAANTLFQWDFDKFTTFCEFIKMPCKVVSTILDYTSYFSPNYDDIKYICISIRRELCGKDHFSD